MVADARQDRGLVIAARARITKTGNKYSVPSATDQGTRYTVIPHGENPSCSCPDFQVRGMKCKHMWAVSYVIEREENADGTTTVTETMTVTETVQKKTTYKQNWPAYNAAQSVEKDRVQELLFDLCGTLTEPERRGSGRKPHTVRDSVFSMVFKVYSTFSSRRFDTDLRHAHERGFLSRPVPGMKTVQFFENADLTPILNRLVHESSLPLRAVETRFAIDSSGFGSSRFDRWIDEKYGFPRPCKKAAWVKVHISCGVKTNVVTAARILERETGDATQFTPLLKETAEGFVIEEVSADKAYTSYQHFEDVAGVGGQFYPAFKANTTAARGGYFEKAFHYFQFKKEEYLSHYHQRSNVESVFSMVKRKFGGEVRSRTDVAMVNEVYCKLIAHNLCVMIQEEHELGIEAIFRPPVRAINA